MTTRFRELVAAAVLAAVVATAVAAYTASPHRSGAARASDMLHSLVDSWRSRARVPAVTAAIGDADGDRWLVASGTPQMRGGGGRVPVQAQFRIASITKLFTATVVLQLVEEHRLSLDDAVSRYVDEVPSNGATVRHLLNHTSGIPDYSMTQELSKQLLDDRQRRWSTSDVYDLVANVEPDFAPGHGYEYSNTNYVILGDVIEAVTGASWAAEVRRRVLDRLKLDDTYVAGFEPAPRDVVPGYFDGDNDGDVEDIGAGRPWPALETSEGAAGAIVSTAGDLLTFGGALFGGALLSDSSLRQMVAESPYHPRNSNYGLGVEILRPGYRTTIWGHGGLLPGYRSVLWYVPAQDAVVVVLVNDTRANPYDLAELLMRAVAE